MDSSSPSDRVYSRVEALFRDLHGFHHTLYRLLVWVQGGLYCPPGVPYRLHTDSVWIAWTVRTVCGLHMDSTQNFLAEYPANSKFLVLVQSTDSLSKFIRTTQMLRLSMECFCVLFADWSLMICADRSMCTLQTRALT